MSVEGTWDLTISTPIGRIKAVVELHRDGDRLTGTARGAGEDVSLTDVNLNGNQLTWNRPSPNPCG